MSILHPLKVVFGRYLWSTKLYQAMENSDFTTTIQVTQPLEAAFAAVNNVRGWWSEDIEGDTDKPNSEFSYHYQDVHSCKMRIIEFVPAQKVVWLVLDNYFKFTTDKSEWIGTKVVFELAKNADTTHIRFTHEGLVPEYECFDICRKAWGTYINDSMRSLITTGKGQPNRKEDFSTSLLVDQTPQAAFAAINNVHGWWTENISGDSQNVNDEFEVRFGDVHYSRQRLTESIPGKKVVWLVTASKLTFVKKQDEWTGATICFEITKQGDKTQVRFTQTGLVPTVECYDGCSGAWSAYINDSLRSLIMTGKGRPEPLTSHLHR